MCVYWDYIKKKKKETVFFLKESRHSFLSVVLTIVCRVGMRAESHTLIEMN